MSGTPEPSPSSDRDPLTSLWQRERDANLVIATALAEHTMRQLEDAAKARALRARSP